MKPTERLQRGIEGTDPSCGTPPPGDPEDLRDEGAKGVETPPDGTKEKGVGDQRFRGDKRGGLRFEI